MTATNYLHLFGIKLLLSPLLLVAMSLAQLTKAVSELNIGEKHRSDTPDQDAEQRRPTHKSQLSHGNGRLMTKFAPSSNVVPATTTGLGTAAAIRMALAPHPTNFTHVPNNGTLKQTASMASLKAAIAKSKIPTASPSKAQLQSSQPQSQPQSQPESAAKPKTQQPAKSVKDLDIGAYDGGLDADVWPRGGTVEGEAADTLALDSSTGR